MSLKGRGISAERELIHLLWKHGIACARVAGSGSSQYPSVDIIAGRGSRKMAIECKSTGKQSKYFSTADIAQAQQFSDRFGAELWFAMRFARTQWYFVSVENLEKAGEGFKITREVCESRGITLADLLGIPSKEG